MMTAVMDNPEDLASAAKNAKMTIAMWLEFGSLWSMKTVENWLLPRDLKMFND